MGSPACVVTGPKYLHSITFIAVLHISDHFFISFFPGCKEPLFGSVLIIEAIPSYKSSKGILNQTSRTYSNCDSYEIKYTWNGTHFRIGPVLSSYSGHYEMKLTNSSGGVWKNFSFCIDVKRKLEI